MHIETYCCSLANGLTEFGFTFKAEAQTDDCEFDMPLGQASFEEFDDASDAAWSKYRLDAERIARDPTQLSAWLAAHSIAAG